MIVFTGCFSSYKRYEKIPCTELGSNPTKYIKKIISESMYIDSNKVTVTDSSAIYTICISHHPITFRERNIKYNDISKVIVQTKHMLSGVRYSLIIIMNDKVKHIFRSFDYNLSINAYSTLECLAGIKPKSKSVNQNTSKDKYDDLKKLKDLYDSGALTKDEYEKEKAKILNEK